MKKILAAMAAIGLVGVASAQSVPLNVSATVDTACAFGATSYDMAFSNYGANLGNVDTATAISLTCNTGASYFIGLSGGGSGDVNARTMGALAYQLYKTTGRTTVWGDTAGDRVGSTGTGAAQSFTIFGRIPDSIANRSVVAGTYTDTVNIVISF
ncbi:MAG: SCPU domain-containing protein [Betaproteobacteria bacterium]|nr:MAG: SCPU domain-containing protein [Betaproteobacteria bacterium]